MRLAALTAAPLAAFIAAAKEAVEHAEMAHEEELLEAARIDGATESQQFFNVTLPQILPTVGVVLTTILVAVAKVFDIVRVSTGGNFGTNVLAHDFIDESFQFLNRGVGSAIAVTILLIVAPVLIFNVYNMQKADS